ncbi:SDR family NAD(P)-dependent oxidoreductase [Streptomyces klenkii]
MAIVGMGLRLPGGITSLDALWSALTEGRDLVGEVPANRFDKAVFTEAGAELPGKSYTAAGGFLEQDIADFDAGYFGISPKEASRIDPQHRLLLECAAEAFDDAGIDPAALAGSGAAVVVGVSTHDYGDLQQRRPRTGNAYTNIGTASCNAANRLSYFFDLQGPSSAVDTACASALTAVHQACEILGSGRSGLALAGGVNVLLNPSVYAGFSAAQMLSPTGRCRPFSAGADGFVRAEGAGVLVLKPLVAALAEGDRVHAVIAGSGANADGRTSGLSLPNPRAQAALLSRVYAAAGIEPDDVAYVEAHGTGTQAGDPVECQALGEVLGRCRTASGALPIGAVKSNVGHLEAASGVAGLAKAVLVLRERTIPATLHAEPRNAQIDFTGLGLEPVTASRPLPGPAGSVVGINSFGFGGANAHLVLAPPPPMPAVAGTDRPVTTEAGPLLPLVISARTQPALGEAVSGWADHLAADARASFYDTAFTACRRRAHHEHRLALLATDPQEAAAALRAVAEGSAAPATATATAVQQGRMGFVFSGNGSQWAGMGADLLSGDRSFAAEAASLDAELTPLLGWSVLEEMAGPQQGRWERTEVAQPLLFVIQAGLVASLRARGVRPAAVCGHSVGEVAAAYAAGVLDRGSACRVIAARSRAQAPTAGAGRMAALGLGAADAAGLLAELPGGKDLVVAAVNSDRDVTVAGDTGALETLRQAAGDQGVFFRDLNLEYAFHSPAMDGLQPSLKNALIGLVPQPAHTRFVSTVTGTELDGTALDSDYWWRNVREPVRFADAITVLTGDGVDCDVLVEIGPHPVLSAYLRRAAASVDRPVAVVSTLSRSIGGPEALDLTVTHLAAVGADIDWSVFFPRPGRVVGLPAYPWQRERHFNGHPDWWLESATGASGRARHPLLGVRDSGPDPVWRQRVEPGQLAWIADHTIDDAVVVPGAAYVEMALAAGQEVFEKPVEIAGLAINRALTLPFDDPTMDVYLHTALSRDGAFTISSRSGEQSAWAEHVRGRVRRLLRERPPAVPVAEVRARLPRTLTAEDHYAACRAAGLDFGPAFRTLTGIQAGDGEFLVDYTAVLETGEPYVAHPSVLDAAFQAGQPLMMAITRVPVPFLPVGVETVRCWRPMPATGILHLRARDLGRNYASWDLVVADAEGRVALELIGCRARRFDGARTTAPSRLTEVLRAAPRPGAAPTPSPLPAPRHLLDASAQRIAELTERWQTHPYAQVRDSGLNLVAHFVASAVRQLLPGRDHFTLDDLFAAGVSDAHRRLLPALLDLAVARGVLSAPAPRQWQIAVDPDPRGRFSEALRSFPSESTSAVVYGACGNRLADILRGRTDPLELLFSGADALAARFYDSNPALAYHHEIARHLLCTLVAGWPADRPLRILEVGAGTGSITAALLPHLPPERTQYSYTDVSAAFMPAARQRFADYSFLEYRCLDLDAAPAEQGFAPGSYDVVIASNVLHAAPDLTRALRHVADLLTDAGHLLAVETHNPDVMLPVVGFLPSFWAATDHDLRPDGPVLPRDQWSGLLERCGFTGTVQTGDTRDPARSDYSVILTARRPRNSETRLTAAMDSMGADGGRRWVIAPLSHEAGAEAFARAVADALRTAARTAQVGTVAGWTESAAWEEALGGDAGATDVVLVDTEHGADLSPADLTEHVVRHLAILRALGVAFSGLPEDHKATLSLITAGSRRGDALAPPACVDTGGAGVWGAMRTLANEHPRVTVRRIGILASDTSGHTAVPWTRQLAAELLSPTEDDEILLTEGGRFVPRIETAGRPVRSSAGSPPSPYILRLTGLGLNYRLAWQEATLPVPGPGEVVVEVAAAALNYRDIMTATGLVPPTAAVLRPEADAIGLECAGTVTAVGPGVTSVAPGDPVAGGAAGCFASHALLRADRILPVPEGMTMAEAATIPMAYMTVHHTLHHLARLSARETVLIHGAAGGVGLAALRYAQLVGANVIATAGTDVKRDLLQLLGAEHVLDSRSLDFADQIMELTDGLGVDVVFNSLAEEAQIRSLNVLKPHGRFLELGKRDFLADHPLPQAPFLRNLSFFGVDITPLIDNPSALADSHIAAIQHAVHHGHYTPLPHRTYPASRIHEAFTAMQHSRHIGKIVITFDDAVPVRPLPRPFGIDPSATYLITGGFSGLGATIARHLTALGARHLTLVGRRGPRTPEGPALLAALQADGAQTDVYAADAADATAMRDIVDRVDASGRRLAGVVHAAMVLDDGDLTDLTDDRLRTVLSPKVTGGHLLDRLTRDRHLDMFVVCSSAATLVGNIRQAPYAAANLALEALVHRRRSSGLPGLAIQWGVLADTGYVHRTGRSDELSTMGLGGLSTAEALATLDAALARTDIATIAVGHIDWSRLRRFLPTLEAPRSRALLGTAHSAENTEQLRTALAEATHEEAIRLAEDELAELLGSVLQAPADGIDRSRRLDLLGMDSLMGAEFAAKIRLHFGCELSVVEIVGAAGLTGLAYRLLAQLGRSPAERAG